MTLGGSVLLTHAAGSGMRAGEERLARALQGADGQVIATVRRGAPPLAQVHQQALRAAGLAEDEVAVWRRRVKRAAMLPRLQVGLRHGLQDNLDLSIRDNVSVTSGGVVIGPRASDIQEHSDRNTFVEVRAVWALNELLFTPDALQVSEEGRRRRQEIRQVLHAATQLYHEWLRLQAALSAVALQSEARATATWRLRALEVAGELDGLTNGWFSQAVGARSVERGP